MTAPADTDFVEELSRTKRPPGPDGDPGLTLVEIMLAVVLIGLVVTATLTSLSVTIRATATNRDHANAHAWLQTASDMLYARPYIPCNRSATPATNIANIKSAYEATIRQTQNPEGWPAANIVIVDLQFWYITLNPATFVSTEGWGSICDNNDDTELQRVTIEVKANDGRIVERVEVILGV